MKQSGAILAVLMSVGAMAASCREKDLSSPPVPGTWAKAYGRTTSEEAHALTATPEGGFAVAGEIYLGEASDTDAWVLRLAGDGSIVWQRAYGGPLADEAYAIAATGDGGLVVAGSTASFGNGGRGWVLKLDDTGALEWENHYGGPGSESFKSVQQTADGGYVLAGDWNSYGWLWPADCWVVKLDAGGAIQWQKKYGGGGHDHVGSIRQTGDGGYVLAAHTDSFGAGEDDAWILKLSSDGEIAWQKTYGAWGNDRAFSVEESADGGYVVAGETESFATPIDTVFQPDAWVLRLASDGSIVWQKALGDGFKQNARVIRPLADGGYVFVGAMSDPGNGYENTWIVRLNADGGVLWQKVYGGWANENGVGLEQALDGGFVAAGKTHSFDEVFLGKSAWVVKTNGEGALPPVALNAAMPAMDTSVWPQSTSIRARRTDATRMRSYATVTDTSVTVKAEAP
ncbi:MAG: PQQ-like beta-propeller repeat protein [Planctomycetes bacterium]|nr:PQQ-like beta-propeller repeat protein [Planctomycetota bacterium]